MNEIAPPRNPPARFIRRTDLTVHELDGEALVYDPESATTHRFNTTAQFIWRLCDGRHDAGQIAERLGETYEVSVESATEHVERMLREFREHQLVETTNGDSLG